MNRRIAFLHVIVAVCVGIGWVAARTVRADDPKPGPAPADMVAQMEAWAKVGAVGPEHDRLKGMIGDWDAVVKIFMVPGQPPQESKGVMHQTSALGGRFIEQRYEGEDMGGGTMNGIGFMGYDNQKKMYVGIWMDSMSTTISTSEGTCDAAGKVWTMMSEMKDPTSGQDVKLKMVITVVDKDHTQFDEFMNGPDGKEFQCMGITYSRKK